MIFLSETIARDLVSTSDVIDLGAGTFLHGFHDHPGPGVARGLFKLRDEDLRLMSILRR